MPNRRNFLKSLSIGSALVASGTFPYEALAARDFFKLTVLHTNDVHSRMEPFPSGKHQGMGGAARRATLIKQIRQQEANVLLLDAGDIFQGTPYFNFFEGELDFKLMNTMGYDAATIGNHDFDAGMEALRKQAKTASFPLLNCNYDFGGTLMDGYTKKYQIFQKGPIKIGVFGVGVELDGLVPPALYGKTKYHDPVSNANEIAAQLKDKEKCDLVICLSHLGNSYETDKVSDQTLAAQTSHIDLIIGGHTHTFLDEPQRVKNRDGEEVLINQVGWAGIMLGRVDFYFRKDFRLRRGGGKAVKVK